MAPKSLAAVLFHSRVRSFGMVVLFLVTLLARPAFASSGVVCDDADAPSEAAAIAQAATEELLSSGAFSRAVDGIATLKVGPSGDQDFGTNPDGIYISYKFSCGSGALPEPYWNFGPFPACGDANGTSSNFVLGAADVVAFFGCTAPPVKYLGFDVVLNTRPANGQDGRRTLVLGTNIGDAVNHRALNTSSSSSSSSGPFDSPVLVAHTADGAAYAAVAKAFVAAGAPEDATNLHALDSSILRFHNRSAEANSSAGADADVLFSLVRASVPVDSEGGSAEALSAYAALEWPVRFFFAADGAIAAEPLAPVPVPRANRVDEVATLSDAFVELQRRVSANWTAAGQGVAAAGQGAAAAAVAARGGRGQAAAAAAAAAGGGGQAASSTITSASTSTEGSLSQRHFASTRSVSSSSSSSSSSVYDPRDEAPGCFGHVAYYTSDDCSGGVRAVEGYAPESTCPYVNASEPTCDAYRAALAPPAGLCERFEDSCCYCPGCWADAAPEGQGVGWGLFRSARLCSSEESLNDAVASCPFDFSPSALVGGEGEEEQKKKEEEQKDKKTKKEEEATTARKPPTPPPPRLGQEVPLLVAPTNKAVKGFYDDWLDLLSSTDWRYGGFVVPTRDALYTIPAGFVPLYRGASVVVVGVNHVLTQNASYQMFAASVMEVQGPDAGSNVVSYSLSDEDLKGSAQRYFDFDFDSNSGSSGSSGVSQEDIDSLWAWDFVPPGGCSTGEDDDGGTSSSSTNKTTTMRPYCTEFDASVYIGKYVKMVLPGERIYSVEPTGVGPRQDHTISSVGLSFYDTADECGLGATDKAPEACDSEGACKYLVIRMFLLLLFFSLFALILLLLLLFLPSPPRSILTARFLLLFHSHT